VGDVLTPDSAAVTGLPDAPVNAMLSVDVSVPMSVMAGAKFAVTRQVFPAVTGAVHPFDWMLKSTALLKDTVPGVTVPAVPLVKIKV